jgi:hypothetical protein
VCHTVVDRQFWIEDTELLKALFSTDLGCAELLLEKAFAEQILARAPAPTSYQTMASTHAHDVTTTNS